MMRIVIELEVPDDDVWATDPPESLGISGNRNGGHADRKGARFVTRGITGNKITSIRYKGVTL